MTLTRLALSHLRATPLTTALNIVLLTLGTASIVVLLLVTQQMTQTLTRNAENIDLVLGAKGSPVQLILSTVYHADIPTGNIPLEEAERWANDRRIATAVPLSLGDSVRGFRIVGTTPDYLTLYDVNVISGSIWQHPLEAVLGAEVAATTGLTIGDTFSGAHGLSGMGDIHDETRYQVVGMLEHSGSVVDRLVLTSLESVWDIHAHGDHTTAHHSEDQQHSDHDDHDDHDLAFSDEKANQDQHNEKQHADREITAMLLQYRSPIAAVSLPRQINRESGLMAAAPAFELVRLLQLIGIGMDALQIFALILVISAALSMFTAMYSALNQRRGDLAMMRCLGATRRDLMVALLIEGLLLAMAGALVGLLLGHGLVELLGQTVTSKQGLSLTGLRFLPAELWLVAGILAVGLVAAALPAWQAYRTDVSRTLAEA